MFCTNYSFLALDSLFLRPVPINRKIHFDILGGSAEKFAFFSSIADSQTWPIDIAKLEKSEIIDVTFAAHVEMEFG